MKNIFISSTFIDMQAERDLVQERVLPALREEARKYGENVGVIDLRWGVDTSTLETEEGAMKVLQVCLDEIDRSHPYMLIFLGERYGTVMREDLIEDSVCGREDKYTTEDYMKSITALEVEYGALSEKYGELNHCVVCFREPVVHMLDGAEKDLYAEHTEEGRRKLVELKERIKRDLGEDDRLITYSCTWDKSARKLVDFRTDGRPLEDVLIEHIRTLFCEEWEYYGNLSWFEKDRLQVKAQQESALMGLVGRETLVAEYTEKMRNGKHVILEGESGSGKTSLLYKTEECLRKEGQTFIVLCGTSENNKDYKGLIRNLCYYFEILVKKDVHKDTKLLELEELEEYYFFLSKEIIEKVYIFIDAIEGLEKQTLELAVGESNNIVYFLSKKRKGSNSFIKRNNNDILFLKEKECEEKKSVRDRLYAKEVRGETYNVWPLRKQETEDLICKGLAVQHRDAYKDIVSSVMMKFNSINPLYVSILLNRLKHIGGELLSNANDESAIVEVCKKCIDEIPDDVCEASYFVIHIIAEKLGKECFEVMEYIAAARDGLRKEDLLGLFTTNKQLDILIITRLLNLMDVFLYEDGNGLLRYRHDVFLEAILEKGEKKEEIRKEICRYIRTLSSTDYLKTTQGIYYAYEMNDIELLKGLILEGENNTFLIERMKKLEKEYGRKLIFRFVDEQMHLLDGVERKVVQDFFVAFFGGCSYRRIFFGLNRPNDIRLCSKLLTKYFDVEGEEVFELYCLSEICRGVLVGNCLVKPLNKYGRSLFKKVGRENKNLEEYKYVAEFFRRWRRNSLSQYRIVLVIKGCVKYFIFSIKECFMLWKRKEIRDKSLIRFRKSSPLEMFWRDIKVRKRTLKLMKSPELADFCMLLGREDLAEVLYSTVREERATDKGAVKIMKRLHVVNDDSFEDFEESKNIRKKLDSNQVHMICNKYVDLAMFQVGQEMYDELQWTFERVCTFGVGIKQDNDKIMDTIIARFGFDIEYRPSNIEQLHTTCTFFDAMLNYLESVSTTEAPERFYLLCGLANNMAENLEASNWNKYALEYYEKSLKYLELLYEKGSSESATGMFEDGHKRMRDIFRELGVFKKSRFYYYYWEQLQEKGSNESVLGMLGDNHERLGDVFHELGDFDKARAHYEKRMEYVEKAGKKTKKNLVLVPYYMKLGNLLSQMKLFSESLEFYEKVLESYNQELLTIRNETEKITYYKQISTVLEMMGRYEEALYFCDKVLKISEEMYINEEKKARDKLQELVESCITLANVLCKMDRREEAMSYFRRGVQLWEEGNPGVGNEAREMLHVKKGATRKYDIAKVIFAAGWLTEALQYSEMALYDSKTRYEEKKDILFECCMLKSELLHAEICFLNEQTEESEENYRDILRHVESKHRVGVNVEETRYYIKAAKGMYLCCMKHKKLAEAGEYLRLAKGYAEKIYERTGLEKDRVLLEEVLSIKG